MNWKIAAAAAIGVVLGAAGGFAAGARGEAKSADEEVKAPPPQVQPAANRQRRPRRSENAFPVQQQAAADEAAVPTVQDEVREERRQGRRGERRRMGPPTEEELEQMKTEDPERYVQTTNRMAQFRRGMERMREREEKSKSIITSVDASLLSPEQREVHEHYQELLAERDALRDAFETNDPNLTDEERRQNFDRMGELLGEIRNIERQEQENLLSAAISGMGLAEEDAADLLDTVKAVVEATSGDFRPPFRPSGGGRGGPRGGGRR
ncbi:MAG: hypothetical protein IJ802_04485 [Kiritimatiellae bacterium]|nr:hypothetical protein [Kiritimatiellia bacterium]